MFATLQRREAAGQRIRIGLIGAGRMGIGIAWHIGRTPGMELVAVADIDAAATRHRVSTSLSRPRRRSARRRAYAKTRSNEASMSSS